MDRGAWLATVHGVARVRRDLVTVTHIQNQMCETLENCKAPQNFKNHSIFFFKLKKKKKHLKRERLPTACVPE